MERKNEPSDFQNCYNLLRVVIYSIWRATGKTTTLSTVVSYYNSEQWTLALPRASKVLLCRQYYLQIFCYVAAIFCFNTVIGHYTELIEKSGNPKKINRIIVVIQVRGNIIWFTRIAVAVALMSLGEWRLLHYSYVLKV